MLGNATNLVDDLEAGELLKIPSNTSEGSGSQETSTDQKDEHGGSDTKVNEQQSDVQMPSLSNGSHMEQVTRSMDLPLVENSNNGTDEILDSATPLRQQEHDASIPRVSNWKHRTSHPLFSIAFVQQEQRLSYMMPLFSVVKSLFDRLELAVGFLCLNSNWAKEDEKKASSNANALNDEMNLLKNEMKLANEAEEKRRKALDDITLALKEAASEAPVAFERKLELLKRFNMENTKPFDPPIAIATRLDAEKPVALSTGETDALYGKEFKRRTRYARMVSLLLSKDENPVDILKDDAQLCYFLQRNLVPSDRPVEAETVTTAKGPGRDDQGSKKEEKGLQILWGYTWGRHYDSKETSGGPFLGKERVEAKRKMFTLSTLEECECVAKRGGVGVQSMISGLIDAYQHAMEEVDHSLLAQKEAEMVLLKVAQMSKETVGEPGAVLDLQCENAQLKVENTSLRKQLENRRA
ncbi:hypothetical protein HAX54_047237 [Datura stramonium]|uniref:Uncharacterized protein n=1 Tax=Datura stramonium TaxID=4076 RepID=A0ABS8SSN9_DATST|nr:hypothetical protein [Datura stramonium]